MINRLKVKLIILIIIISTFSVSAYGENIMDNTGKAEVLKELGMFQGTENGFELHRQPTRVESAIMLVRLLGVEKDVKEGKYNHPFTDVPKWADNYVGYMYEKGLTTGIGGNSFGSNNLIDVKSYATFVLRSLGYSDSNGDFTWKNALAFSEDKGLLTMEEINLLNKQSFKRDGLVLLSYNALKTKLKNLENTLSEKLMIDGVIRPHLAYKNNLIDKEKYKSLPIAVKMLNGQINIDFMYSKVDNFEALGVVNFIHTGVWYEPISRRELMMALILSDDNIKIYKEYQSANAKELFKDLIDNPMYTHNSMYGLIVLYDKDYSPVYYIEQPKNLQVGTYQLPLIPVDKELKVELMAEEKKFNEYYIETRKGITIFPQTAITIDKTGKDYMIKIDRNKLPETLKDFEYAMTATSNSNYMESAIYRTIKQSWLKGGYELDDFSHKYIDQVGTLVRNNAYASIYLFSKDQKFIGCTSYKINN